jgi:hypothetical protein
MADLLASLVGPADASASLGLGLGHGDADVDPLAPSALEMSCMGEIGDMSGLCDMDSAATAMDGAADWAWDAPVDAAEEMRALLEMWPAPAPAENVDGFSTQDLDLDLSRYIDSAALGLDLGVSPQSIGAF